MDITFYKSFFVQIRKETINNSSCYFQPFQVTIITSQEIVMTKRILSGWLGAEDQDTQMSFGGRYIRKAGLIIRFPESHFFDKELFNLQKCPMTDG